jgi:tetratricopeptide (TPR) repeat protein
LKQYQQAEKYYLESITWSKEVVVQFQYGAWQRMSRFYVENGQYAKAQQYLQLLLAASKEQIIPSHQIEVHLLLFKVDSAQGNYLAAIQQYQLYKALNDSIFNEKKSNQIEHLSIQYETKKKEQDIKLKGKDIALAHRAKQIATNPA